MVTQISHEFKFRPGDMVYHRQSAHNKRDFERAPVFMIIENHLVLGLNGNLEPYYLIRPDGPDTSGFHRTGELELIDSEEYKLIIKMSKDNE